MSAALALLAELQCLGVEVTGDGGKLHIKAPAGVMTEARRRMLADVKPEVLALLGTPADTDDRRHCHQCANLAGNGLCRAAERGELPTSRQYRPIDWPPRRCAAFAPTPQDPDQRPGRLRWPWILKAPEALQ